MAKRIDELLPQAEKKIWHAHPVWFLEGNPIVGFSKLKNCIRLLFWSGQSFGEEKLKHEGSFKAAEIRYTSIHQIDANELKRWLKKAETIQWDYNNLIKRKGRLEPLKGIKALTNTKQELPSVSKKFKTIDEYHQSFPKEIQIILQVLRQTIKQAAPKTTEIISYNMPAFKLNKVLVYYAVYKQHVGFYPTASPIIFFKKELLTYKTSKGAIQFPINKALPISLIKKIVKFRLLQDLEKHEVNKQK